MTLMLRTRRSPQGHTRQPVRAAGKSVSWAVMSGKSRRGSRTAGRRGRGVRGPVMPNSLPAYRTRAQRFDQLAVDAFARIDNQWHERLTALDIAVDEVPPIKTIGPDLPTWPDDVVADGSVPLSRLVPAGVDKGGAPTRARIVLFRRPLERRARHPELLIELIHEVLVAQIAAYLGVDPEVIDPELPLDPPDGA